MLICANDLTCHEQAITLKTAVGSAILGVSRATLPQSDYLRVADNLKNGSMRTHVYTSLGVVSFRKLAQTFP
jgi:hypothetical protein